MKKTTKVALISIPTLIIIFVVGFWLPIYILSPQFGKPRVKNIIQIYSDTDFENYDFTGTGNSNDPYIIENRVLGVNTSGVKRGYYGLDVANTSKYFIVQNCTFFGGLNAIRLENITDETVLIRGNSFYAIAQSEWDNPQGRSGIEIRKTNQVTIKNNTFAPANKYVDYYYILTIYKVNNVLFENNTCEGCFLDIRRSTDVQLVGNLFEEAFYFEDLYNLNFANNIFYGEHDFIEFTNCSYSFFKENIFYERISVWKTLHTVLSCNRFNSNSGLHLIGSSYMEISNNSFVCTTEEISTYDVGILLERESKYCIIQANSIYNFSNYGIYLTEDSNYNIIYHNSMFDNFIINSTSQAFDECYGNLWNNPSLFQGNYWSNLGLNTTYEIDGSAGSVDLYPLSSPLI
ncbi:MAG: hypothetical protein HGN29_08955 [Asgard group archaeon]|nr:hypothetical protein [Asgard group archaeon]